ncbi:hypothetical protein KGQ71_01530 [Patescibacteria group bacterium]|nr:hypothetical protein [Patescibacteria group bacterium]
MAASDFIEGLKALGYEVEELGGNCIAFDYEVPTGKFMGKTFRLGFVVNEDFPANSPSGPHVSPSVHPIISGGTHPTGGIHAPQNTQYFVGDWQYWSRPYSDWANSDHTVRSYMSHIHHLFDTQ